MDLTRCVADPDPGSGAFLTPGSRIRDPGCVKNQESNPGFGFGINIVFPNA
jgi:hypothetical protein